MVIFVVSYKLFRVPCCLYAFAGSPNLMTLLLNGLLRLITLGLQAEFMQAAGPGMLALWSKCLFRVPALI
jgi:hypothetical protein